VGVGVQSMGVRCHPEPPKDTKCRRTVEGPLVWRWFRNAAKYAGGPSTVLRRFASSAAQDDSRTPMLCTPTPNAGAPATHMTHDTLSWLDSLLGSGIRPGWAACAFSAGLGHPERAYPSIIVAGTNGKGSTSATLASILNVSDIAPVSTPHLTSSSCASDWKVGDASIDDESLVRAIDSLRITARKTGITPTYFEALTLIAFIAFAHAGCEVAVSRWEWEGGSTRRTSSVRSRL